MANHDMESDLTEIIERTQRRIFDADDTVCLDRARLVTEADRLFADRPAALRRALCFDHILRHMTLDLATNPVFAGNTSTAPRAWMLCPEFGLGVPSQVSIEHDHLAPDWLEDKVPRDIVDYWAPRQIGHTPGGSAGIGHMSIDFDIAVNRGLQSVVDELEQLGGSGTPAQQTCREAMAVACRAVMAWAARYAEAAERLAEAVDDPVVAACHRRVARACARVPARPARGLFEGFQSMLLVHLATVVEGQGMSQSVGLPDRVLARFAGEASAEPEYAAQLASAFVLGVAANSYLGRGSKTQAVTVGGADADGRDCANAVSLALLEGFARTPVGDPHLFVRWHEKLSPALWRRSMEMLAAGRSMPMLVNDREVAPGLQEIGIAHRDAWGYCIAGCNEIGIPGRATHTAFALGVSLVDVALLRDEILAARNEIESADDLLRRYEARVEAALREGLPRGARRLAELAGQAPFPFTSACCRGAVEAGADYLESMPYRDIQTVFVRGTANAVNALAAVEHVVFRDARLTMEQLADALQRDDPTTLALLAEAPRWGRDDPRADRWAAQLHEARQRAMDRVQAECGMPIILCHVIRSLHHVSGGPLGATPDGRRAGRPLSDSIGPEGGAACDGPTALLSSVARLDARRFYKSSYNLNLSLPCGQASPELLDGLCRGFFESDGQELQVNVLDAAVLKHARSHPEAHGDLVVRVAGLNMRFVELSAAEQDELVHRAEAAQATV